MTTQLVIPQGEIICQVRRDDSSRSPLRVKLVPQPLQGFVATYAQYLGPTFKRKVGSLTAIDLRKILENNEYIIVEG